MNEITPTERAAMVTARLYEGQRLTPLQVAVITQCDLSTAYRVLKRVSRVVIVAEDKGTWQRIRDEMTFDADTWR